MTKKEQRYLLNEYSKLLDKACDFSIRSSKKPSNVTLIELSYYYHGQASAIRNTLEYFTGKQLVWSTETNQFEMEDAKEC